jgi:predicted nucleic acid binding AN1-type Zn finger protein
MVKAIFISFNEVVCPVPETGSYIVQVSNDNHMFTPESIFTVYDDECHTCGLDDKIFVMLYSNTILLTKQFLTI